MYTTIDFTTHKALANALKQGVVVGYYQVGPFGGNEPNEGIVYLEGPHYPRPHRWYAKAEVRDGRVIKLLK